MKLSPAFQGNAKSIVCRRQRSIYGLKQAGRQWYAKLSHFLKSNKYDIFVAGHFFF